LLDAVAFIWCCFPRAAARMLLPACCCPRADARVLLPVCCCPHAAARMLLSELPASVAAGFSFGFWFSGRRLAAADASE